MPGQLRIFVLGATRFEFSDGTPLAFPGPKAAAVLACLAASPSLRAARSDLVGLLWGDSRSTPAARHALRQCLLRLRAGLGEAADLLGADAESVWLEADCVRIDLVEARQALQDHDMRRIRDFSASIGATFCDGLEVKTREFEDWMRQQRPEAERLCALLHDRASAALADAGRLDEALLAAHRRVAVEPYEESAHAALVSLYLRAGRRQAAVQARDACIALFRRDLDIEPGIALPPAQTPKADPPRFSPEGLPAPALARPQPGAAIRAGLLGVFAAAFLIHGGADETRRAPKAEAGSTATMTPWITAGAAKAVPRGRSGGAVQGQGDPDGARQAAVRKMLEGDANYAMLYPVGC